MLDRFGSPIRRRRKAMGHPSGALTRTAAATDKLRRYRLPKLAERGDRVTCTGADTYDEPLRDDANARRSYIGVYFECCGVYARVYRQPSQTAYHCRCPRCLRQVRVRVGPEGTNARLFRAH